MKYRNRFSIFTLLGLTGLFAGGFFVWTVYRFMVYPGETLANRFYDISQAVATGLILLSSAGMFLKLKRTRIVLSAALHISLIIIIIRLIVYGNPSIASIFPIFIIYLFPITLFLIVLHNSRITAYLEKEWQEKAASKPELNTSRPEKEPIKNLKSLVWVLAVPSFLFSVWIVVISCKEVQDMTRQRNALREVVVVASTNISAGTILTKQNLASSRSKHSESEQYISVNNAPILLGHKILKAKERGDAIGWYDTDIVITNNVKPQQTN